MNRTFNTGPISVPGAFRFPKNLDNSFEESTGAFSPWPGMSRFVRALNSPSLCYARQFDQGQNSFYPVDQFTIAPSNPETNFILFYDFDGIQPEELDRYLDKKDTESDELIFMDLNTHPHLQGSYCRESSVDLAQSSSLPVAIINNPLNRDTQRQVGNDTIDFIAHQSSGIGEYLPITHKLTHWPFDEGQKPKCYNNDKETMQAKKHKYYIKNREAILVRQKNYYINNKTTIKFRVGEYRSKNKEAIKAKRQDHYKINRNAILASQRKYRMKNKAAIQARQNVYYAEHRDIILSKRKGYRAKNADSIGAEQQDYEAKYQDLMQLVGESSHTASTELSPSPAFQSTSQRNSNTPE
ncbi:hypothetical protein [Endozoicomonas sp. ONNA2]|uniref:hypothetical protein n=1 Tax=Endozoicomonas sp. ONNA2 TaxID=2828741 RepID=UPI00214865A3|nr:hypothetical protein [Endozoicomonas sp. ONNA2]